MIYQRKEVTNVLEDKIIELYIKGLKPIEIQELTGVCIPTIMTILGTNCYKYTNEDMVSFKTTGDSILVIADTHIGHRDENLKYIDEAYETGVKNNVSCCIHLGDIVEGNLIFDDAPIEVQMEKIMDYYPEPDEFNTYLTMGNHDYHVFSYYKNYLKMLESKKGMNVLGYKRTYFDWNGYTFGTEHKIANDYFPDNFILEKIQLYFVGHGHELKQKSTLRLKAPTLSDNIIHNRKGAFPGFLIANLEDDAVRVDVYDFKENKARVRKMNYLTKEMIDFPTKK